MDFDVDADVKERIELARQFSQEVIRPAEEELDRIADPLEAFTSETHRSVTKQICSIDLHKLGLPAEFGGLGLDPLAKAMVEEEVAAAGAGLASQLLLTPVGAGVIATFGLADRHPVYKEYLDAFLEDTDGIHQGAWTITEPDCGSELFTFGRPEIHLQAKATAGGAGYVINGTKSAWCSNGWLADMYLVMVSVDPDAGMEGTGTFLIPGDWPGVSKGQPISKLGLRALNQAEVVFDGVEVPAEFLLLPPGPAYPMLLETIVTGGNTAVGTIALGVARAAYEAGLTYAKERRQDGSVIIDHQLVARKLFDAFQAVEASRLMLHRSAWLVSQGRGSIPASFAARAQACETAMKVTADMMLLFGAYGITKEYPVEKLYRDAAPLQIMDGTIDKISITAAARL